MSVRITALTRGPLAHFFGYFDQSPWRADGGQLLMLETAPVARMPGPGETVTLLCRDLVTHQTKTLGVSRAWNWQQGCRLAWRPGFRDQVIYNDQRDDGILTVLRDIETGAERVLPRGYCDVSPDGGRVLGIDFLRLARARAVCGYSGGAPGADQTVTDEEDGLWLTSLEDGKAALILSLAEAIGLRAGPEFETAHLPAAYAGKPGFEQPGEPGHRFEGGQFSPSGRRVVATHRWPRRAPLQLAHFQRHFWDRLVVIDLDSGAKRVIGEDGFYSHLAWMDDDRLLCWCTQGGKTGMFVLDVNGREEPKPFAEGIITADPHASFSPDRRWLLGDSYPDANRKRHLWLYDCEKERLHALATLDSPPPYDRGPLRCDLHPRWRPDGKAVCVDSCHEQGVRQMYEVDVTDLLNYQGTRHQG